MRRMKIFILNGLILTATSFLMRMVGMCFNVYISNKIGSEALGVFGLILSVYMFSITLATSGINLAATRIVTIEMTNHAKNGAKLAMKKCLSYSLFFGILSGILLSMLAPMITFYLLHDQVSYSLFYMISISLPFISMSSALNGYFTALRKNGRNAATRVFEQFVKISATSYLLSLFLPTGLEYACLSLVLGEAISEIMSFLFVFVLYLLEQRKYTNEKNSSMNYRKAILEMTLPVSVTSYIRSGLSSLKQLLIPLRLEKSGMSCEQALSNYGLITRNGDAYFDVSRSNFKFF